MLARMTLAPRKTCSERPFYANGPRLKAPVSGQRKEGLLRNPLGGGLRFHRGHIYDELMRSLTAVVAERSASALPGTMRSDMP